MTPQIVGLFEGFGGLTMAVRAVLGGDLIAYSEIEPAACRLLEYRNPGVPNVGDVTVVDWSTVERDARRLLILTGGFPCTDVSSAGKQLGLRPGTRSGLWHHMAYAVAQLRPDLVVIENVRGLLTARGAEPTAELLDAWATRDRADRALAVIESKLRRAVREGNMPYVHRHHRDRARILGRRRTAVAAAKRADALIVRAIAVVLGDLAELGYDAQWYGLRASDGGAPHNRFRIFIIARPAADTDSFGPVRGGTARRRRPGSPDDGVAPAAGARRVPDWGPYEPAIRRWESIIGRVAPPATGPGPRGAQQLSPLFVEWMMGLPLGHVTGVPGLSRAEQLKMLGNGVVPLQAAAALEFLLGLDEAWAA